MFELSKELLETVKRALEDSPVPAMEGPQIYFACKTGCSGACKNTCRGECKGSCKGSCTRSCQGHSR